MIARLFDVGNELYILPLLLLLFLYRVLRIERP